MSVSTMQEWEESLIALRADWAVVTDGLDVADGTRIARWTERMGEMRDEMWDWKSRGEWLGGPRTLLHVLKLEQRELVLTAGLAWLLDPENFHRLGDRMLVGFLAHLGINFVKPFPVRIDVEESNKRTDEPQIRTRADLLLRVAGVTVLVEAKVGAGEQDDQCTRLADEWSEESPVLVFLTPDGREPESAGERMGEWKRVRWSHIAEILAAAVATLPDDRAPAPGVLDYLATLQHFHGSTSEY